MHVIFLVAFSIECGGIASVALTSDTHDVFATLDEPFQTTAFDIVKFLVPSPSVIDQNCYMFCLLQP